MSARGTDPDGTSLAAGALTALLEQVERDRVAHARARPGPVAPAQPVHSVYVPADQFAEGTPSAWAGEARRLFAAHMADDAAMARVLGLDDYVLAGRVRERVGAKLDAEPIEDLRVDFEDGYGARDDGEEDGHARATAASFVALHESGDLPGRVGLRVKSFAGGPARRSIRTLDLFVTAAVAGGVPPDALMVTFPKVVTHRHVAAFAEVCARLEQALGLPDGALRFEVQLETTELIVGADGRVGLPDVLAAAAGRLAGVHMGVFDYTAALALAPAEQHLAHPALDFARNVLQVAVAGTGVPVSDGGSNVVPAGGDTASVQRAWRTHAAAVTHALRAGYVQGWDMHPAQLVSRFAAVYAWYLNGIEALLERLRAAGARAAVAGVLEEPATVRPLAIHVTRARDCGALGDDDLRAAGIDPDALRTAREASPWNPT